MKIPYAIKLEAGKKYYIEAHMKEGGGGDNLSVAWQGPGIAQVVIAGSFLSPFVPQNQPPPPAIFALTVSRAGTHGTAAPDSPAATMTANFNPTGHPSIQSIAQTRMMSHSTAPTVKDSVRATVGSPIVPVAPAMTMAA